MSTRINRVTTTIVVLACMGSSAFAQTMQQLSTDITSLVRDAVPSVVSVTATRSTPWADKDKAKARGAYGTTGTGFVIEPGYVLTSYTVVANADSMELTFPDGSKAKGALAGKDRMTNTALIKIDGTSKKPLKLGDSETLMPGALVVSVSNRGNATNSITLGVVSATDAHMSGMASSVLRISGNTGPGASGGPIFDSSGKVVGMTVAMLGEFLPNGPRSAAPDKQSAASKPPATGKGASFVPAGSQVKITAPRVQVTGDTNDRHFVVGYTDVGSISGSTEYAVPVNTIKSVLTALESGKEIERGYIGLLMDARNSDAPAVAAVEPDGPAAKAGVKPGDVIVSADGKTFAKCSEFSDYILSLKPGSTMKLVVKRNGKNLTFGVTVGKRPEIEDMLPSREDFRKYIDGMRDEITKTGPAPWQTPDLAVPFSLWTNRRTVDRDSLNIENAGIEQVAKALMDVYKVNVVVANPDNITGRVSIHMSAKTVKIDDALSSICSAIGCRFEKKGETYIITAK